MARAKKAAPAEHVQFTENGGVLAVGSRSYAIGMFWASLTEKKPVAQARRSAAENGADLFCIRKPDRAQYGLGSTSTGHRTGMPSLAAHLADAMAGNFVAAFETEAGFYFVAVRDGQILAGCDRLFQGHNDAVDAFESVYGGGGSWEMAIAPKGWEIDGTKAETLGELLARSKPRTKLEAVSRTGTVLKVAGLGVALTCAYVGYSQYQAHVQAQRDAEQARMIAENNRRAEEAMRARMAFKVPPMPWEGQTPGQAVIDACAAAILKAPVDVAGWTPVSVSCVPDGAAAPTRAKWMVSVALRRDGGTVNWIGPAYNRDGFRPPVTESRDGSVAVTWPIDIPAAATFDKNSPTVTSAKARRYLTTQFEEVFQPIELRDGSGSPVPAPGSEKGQKKRTIILERHLAFSLRTGHDPKDFDRILAPVPALVATSVKLDLATWNWTIEGTIYERIPLPDDLRVGQNAPKPAPRR